MRDIGVTRSPDAGSAAAANVGTAVEIWLCLCIGPPDSRGKAEEETFAFSSMSAATSWADQDGGRMHVIYSRVLDHPEIADMTAQ